MPLLNTLQQTNAAIIAQTENVAAHLQAAANAANRIVSTLLALSDDDLAAWLNEQGDALGVLLMRHADTGKAINDAGFYAAATLLESGILRDRALVDTRPLTAKLADQNRVAELTAQGWTVTTTAPEPQPEPEEEA